MEQIDKKKYDIILMLQPTSPIRKKKQILLVNGNAIQNKKDFSEAYNNLGNTKFKLGFIDEAVKNYKKAISKAPRDDETIYSYANFLIGTGKRKEGIEYLSIAITRETKSCNW